MERLFTRRVAHDWLRQIKLTWLPGPSDALLDEFGRGLLAHFRAAGHQVLAAPEEGLDVLLTTATFGEPLNWRRAMLFVARRQYKLQHAPLVFTILHATPEQLQEKLDYFARVLVKDPPDPADYAFPGLTEVAYQTLFEQGRRGGPILAQLRLMQSQAMCIRIILVIGYDRPLEAYTFDLVGAHPRTPAADSAAFYDDLMLRILTAVSTDEVTKHQVVDPPVLPEVWQALATPAAMRRAGRELGVRNFFTEMVKVDNLVAAPVIHTTLSNQYSEGCYATWDTDLNALVTTITGSARPVDKERLTDDELAIITGLRPDDKGAAIRHVIGLRNDPPSSEAVEMMQMDRVLPRLTLGPEWGPAAGQTAPVVRSKLHGHRGVRSFDPQHVEHVHLTAPYYYYPVSCSTEAQASAIQTAFGAAAALQNPADPRQIVFTVLPGHGVVLAEKWVAGKAPFQVLWEAMDAGWIEVENAIPQGPLDFAPNGGGRMVLVDLLKG